MEQDDMNKTMPMVDGAGVHVRMLYRLAQDNPAESMAQIEIWPIPLDILPELLRSVQAHVCKFLEEQPSVIDTLRVQGPMH